jgi:hypothetical protein
MIGTLFEAIATLPHDHKQENGETVHLSSCRRCAIQRQAMRAHETFLDTIRTVNELFGEIDKLRSS